MRGSNLECIEIRFFFIDYEIDFANKIIKNSI